jgi:ribonucleoside-triphosphate reductase
MGKTIADKEGEKFALEIMNFILDRLKDIQEKTGHLYNFEASPAEGASYRLAKIDKKVFKDIITAGNDEPYYTNSSLLPVDYTDDLSFALEHQNKFQPLYTGGTVFHIFLGEAISNPESVKLLIKQVTANYKIPYFSITPTFSICPDHGYINGEHFKCPMCGKETEVYSRVVGYFRPVKNWNKGKKNEFKARVTYNKKSFEEKNIFKYSSSLTK